MSSSNKRDIIIILRGSETRMHIYSKNIRNNEEQEYFIENNSIEHLLEQIYNSFNINHIKAIVFRTYEYMENAMKCKPFNVAYEFRLKCREFCQKYGIFFLFSGENEMNSFAALSQTKTIVKEGEKVMVVYSTTGGAIIITYLIREKYCYRIVDMHVTMFPKLLQENYMKNFKPKKIILIIDELFNPSIEGIKNLFKSYNPVCLYQCPLQKPIREACIEQILYLMGEKTTNEYIVATSCRMDYFDVRIGSNYIIKGAEYESVPFEKFFVVDRDPSKSVVLCTTVIEAKPSEIIKEIKLSSFKSKKIKIILKVDINSFYELNVVPVEDEKPKLRVGDKPEKVQITFDKQHFSVTLFANGNKEYAMKDSDGLEKTPIYIAFTQKKPFLGKAAKEAYDEKPEFVVYDLIKLCSISSADVMNPRWKFELSKNPESDSIAVTFQSEKGKTKSDVPFLMALILRNAIKRVFKETGKVISEIGIGFDGFSPNEMLKKNFAEAGKLMKCNLVFI